MVPSSAWISCGHCNCAWAARLVKVSTPASNVIHAPLWCRVSRSPKWIILIYLGTNEQQQLDRPCAYRETATGHSSEFRRDRQRDHRPNNFPAMAITPPMPPIDSSAPLLEALSIISGTAPFRPSTAVSWSSPSLSAKRWISLLSNIDANCSVPTPALPPSLNQESATEPSPLLCMLPINAPRSTCPPSPGISPASALMICSTGSELAVSPPMLD